MQVEKITCYDCQAEIIPYENKQYGGKRGKCQICGTDFPLE